MQTYQNYHLSGLKSFWPPPPHQESPPLKGKKDKGLKNAADMDASPDGKKKKKDAAYGSPVVGAPSLHRGVPPPEKGRWGGGRDTHLTLFQLYDFWVEKVRQQPWSP